jgi:hypothetical protein
MTGISPTKNSLRLLRDTDGWPLVEVVEKWVNVPPPGHRVDLFGFGDILALRPGATLLVQCTAYSGVSARCKKIREHENVDMVRAAGWMIHVHGWEKVGNRWVLKRFVDMTKEGT